ncbi:hypothetical protein ABK040_009253 [Willaertia magna]
MSELNSSNNNKERERQPFIPVDKLKSTEDILNSDNAIIILNGSFNPIHKNHIKTLEDVKNYLKNKLNYNILGGYITIRPDCSIIKKFKNNLENVIPAIHRIKLCELTVKNSDWIMVDNFQIFQDHQIQFKESREQFFKVINEFYLNLFKRKVNFKIFSIVGIDNLKKCNKTLCQSNLICVNNRENKNDFNLEQWINEFDYRKQVIIMEDEGRKEDISSSLIREKVRKGESISEYVCKEVEEYHKENGINYVNSFVPKENIKNYDVYCKVNNICKELNLLFIPFNEFKNCNEKLGEGVHGEVILMKYKENKVALKSINLDKKQVAKSKFGGFQNKFESFIRELEVLANIRGHENVLNCLGVTMNNEMGYIVLEYCDYQLKEYLKELEEKWTPSQCKSICLDIAKGMEYVHKKDIVHRDLTISNIMLCKRDDGFFTAKIIDFHVAKRLHWKTQIPRGCMRNYSPEASLNRSEYEKPSDVFMFANCVYEITHGHEIFEGIEKTGEVLKLVNSGKRPEITSKLDDNLLRVLIDCWNEDCSLRPSFGDVVKSLSDK